MDICRNVDELQAKVNQDVETLLEGRKLFVRTLKSNTKILLLQDDKRGKSEVAIISGSGDAHGPTFANLIGPGLLTCAVRGTVSESPKSNHIVLAANALIHAGYSGGFLLIARNWHDDVKHFREAQEELKQSGSNVELVCVKDDCSHRQESDRRGLAGLFLIIKMAGACSQLGMSLEDIYKAVIDASKTLGTIGVSLPLKSAGYRRRSLRMKFGLGLVREHDVTLRSLIQSGDAMNNCWVRSCIASDFLQTIIRGLLKLIHSYEKCGKYFSGILNVDNIGYKDSDIEDPYFLCDEGDSAASSSYYDDLESTIIAITIGIHKIAVPFELMMFCSLLSQSTKNGFKARINHDIFLYDIQSNKIIKQGDQSSSYRDDKWDSMISYDRHMLQYATKSQPDKPLINKIGILQKLEIIFPDALGKLYHALRAEVGKYLWAEMQ